jgi:hypothetical protein
MRDGLRKLQKGRQFRSNSRRAADEVSLIWGRDGRGEERSKEGCVRISGTMRFSGTPELDERGRKVNSEALLAEGHGAHL